jgi:hypothetical protein
MKKQLLRVTLILFCYAIFGLANGYAQTTVRFGNSYVNLSKRTAGGTVEPGDTLEIRTNYYFPGGFNSGNIYFVRYMDNLPTNTSFVGDSLYLITNEGLLVKKYSRLSGDDLAAYKANPSAGEYNIRMNIGAGASNVGAAITNAAAGGGNVKPGTHRPLVAGGTLITTAFRVRVIGNPGDIITLGAGELRYKKSSSSSTFFQDSIVRAIRYQILISRNSPICADAVGKNFAAEFGGTFGAGSTHNRPVLGSDLPVPGYIRRPLSPSTETNDGYYTIVNNLSPRQSNFRYALKKPNCGSLTPPNQNACGNRMFGGHWDIIGDHTGSTTPDGNNPVASGGTGGYMLVVNSDYATGEAYRQSITGLCPNTSYEFSLWVRNVCTNCGIDSTGTQTWKPGVLPNLTFAIDDLDRYSSGMIDTVGWIKKGFMFKTGPTQENIVISIRNNASGGGGNDWAIDDIALVTCNPNLTMLPSATTNVCAGDNVRISALVRSFFDNYTEWMWERSTDGGLSWQSTGVTGSSTAVDNGSGQYEYEAFYPTFISGASTNGHKYRFRVASTQDNLSEADCSFLNVTTIQINVENCVILPTKLLSFTGQLNNGNAYLKWVTDNETPNTIYEVERSSDGTSFSKIASVQGISPDAKYTYNFTDPKPAGSQAYYRIKMVEGEVHKYSKIILLSSKPEYSIRNLANPFGSQISFDIVSPERGKANIQLTDLYGRIVKQSQMSIMQGLNEIFLRNLDHLSNGMYALRIQIGERIITKQVLKTNPGH